MRVQRGVAIPFPGADHAHPLGKGVEQLVQGGARVGIGQMDRLQDIVERGARARQRELRLRQRAGTGKDQCFTHLRLGLRQSIPSLL